MSGILTLDEMDPERVMRAITAATKKAKEQGVKDKRAIICYSNIQF